MSSDVIGQLVTPQNSEIMPTAVHSDGSKPVRLPNRHPNVAPMKKDGTISPPLKPAPRVSAVKMIFSRNVYTALDDTHSCAVVGLVSYKHSCYDDKAATNEYSCIFVRQIFFVQRLT